MARSAPVRRSKRAQRAKRSVDGYKPFGLKLRGREIPEEAFDALCAGVPAWPANAMTTRKILHRRIEKAAQIYRSDAADQAKPTPHQLAAELREVESLAARLAAKVQAKSIVAGRRDRQPHALIDALLHGWIVPSDEEEYPPPRGAIADAQSQNLNHAHGSRVFADELMRQAAQGVLSLQVWAGQAAESAEAAKLPQTGKLVHKGDVALHAFTVAVMTIWKEVLANTPNQSVQFRTFLGNAYRCIGHDLRPAAVRQRIREVTGRRGEKSGE